MPARDAEPTRFEVIQRMFEPAWTEHLERGEPVRRVIAAPAFAPKHSSRRERDVLSSDNLSRHGFSFPQGSLPRTLSTNRKQLAIEILLRYRKTIKKWWMSVEERSCGYWPQRPCSRALRPDCSAAATAT